MISAVGHEPDVTIADFVADLRAATPSNAGELAVPDRQEIAQQLHTAGVRTRKALERQMTALAQRLEELASRPVMASPTAFLDSRRQDVDGYGRRLTAAAEKLLGDKREKYVRLAASLDALSPLKVLARGYSMAADESGRIVTDAGQVDIGSGIDVTLARGALRCRVEDKTEV